LNYGRFNHTLQLVVRFLAGDTLMRHYLIEPPAVALSASPFGSCRVPPSVTRVLHCGLSP